MSLPDIYLVHGWKAGQVELKAALMTMGAEAVEEGVHVVFTRDGKEAFLGHVLVSVNAAEGLVFGDVAAPSTEDGQKLKATVEKMKLSAIAKSEPRMWVVVG